MWMCWKDLNFHAETTDFTVEERRMWPKLVRALRESSRRYDKSKAWLVVNAAGAVAWEQEETGGVVIVFAASLPTEGRLLADGGDPVFMYGCSKSTVPSTRRFLLSVQALLSFAYPGKFVCEDPNMPPFAYPGKCGNSHADVPSTVCQMASDYLLNLHCDDELQAAVCALKADMPSLFDLAYDCVVVNGLAAALEHLELGL
ncbi:hypothetical protein FOA52_001084 [Chlamydomonas sp. UWO 241]|nr:hypothetical protein FOA52_001084 [Chlamydomonas sp. UWO 241]